jgi:hypothetical protein
MLIWLVWAIWLCQLGFGEDADAWLLNRSAAVLRQQQVYDPARSLGNPFYECLLALLGPPSFPGLFSNLLNLALAIFFLYRLRLLFGDENQASVFLLRICLMASPLFTGMATASMEFMPAWCLFLEALLAWRRGREIQSLVFLGLMAGFRPEWALLPALALGLGRFLPGDKKKLPGTFLLLLPVFLLWAWAMEGKNPLPYDSISGYFGFSIFRMGFLIREAGLVSVFYLWTLLPLLRRSSDPFLLLGQVSLLLFAAFPYEWAYLFPAMLLGLIHHFQVLNQVRSKAWLIPGFVVIASCIYFFQEKTLSLSLPAPALRRWEMQEIQNFAADFPEDQKGLLLFGATYLTHEPENWTTDAEHRIFRHKKGHLLVAEKLNSQQIDSCRNMGYRVYGHVSEKAQLAGTAPDQWVETSLPVWAILK